jgi:hypothetical protein
MYVLAAVAAAVVLVAAVAILWFRCKHCKGTHSQVPTEEMATA